MKKSRRALALLIAALLSGVSCGSGTPGDTVAESSSAGNEQSEETLTGRDAVQDELPEKNYNNLDLSF